MALTNVGELKAAVADWINREDIASVIPSFITQADHRILADSRSSIIPLDEEVLRVLTPAQQTSPVAGDVGVPLSVLVDDKIIPVATWETYWQTRYNNTGNVWTYYEGKVWYTGFPDRDETPVADGNPDVNLRIKTRTKEPVDVSDDANTSLLLTAHGELYLYAALTEAATYLRDMEGLTLYQARYDGLYNEIAKGYTRRKIANGFNVASVGGDHSFDRSY